MYALRLQVSVCIAVTICASPLNSCFDSYILTPVTLKSRSFASALTLLSCANRSAYHQFCWCCYCICKCNKVKVRYNTAVIWRAQATCTANPVSSRSVSSVYSVTSLVLVSYIQASIPVFCLLARDAFVRTKRRVHCDHTVHVTADLSYGWIVQYSRHPGTKACPPIPSRRFPVPSGSEVGYGCAN